MILSGVAGIGVLRRERLAIFSQLRTGVAITEPLLSGLPDRVLRVIGGLLLIIPGLVSDFLALSLLIPGSAAMACPPLFGKTWPTCSRPDDHRRRVPPAR